MQSEEIHPKIIALIERNWVSAKRQKVCMHPEAPAECSRKYGKAHSVQRSKLNRIADNGHVLKVKSDPMTGEPGIGKIGIRQASTFYGFCNFHDDRLFAPIEKGPLVLNPENALLLAFRGMSIHLYFKRQRSMTDLFSAVPRQQVPPGILRKDELIRGGLESLLSMAEPIYDKMGNAILQRDFNGVNWFAIIFNTVPDILCSEASMINFGFQGRMVRERPVPYDFMTLSLLPYEKKRGIAVFAWYGKCETNENFLRSLLSLPQSEFPDAIVRFTFRYLGNFFIAPRWWNNLSQHKQKCLTEKVVDRSPLVDFTEDGQRYVNWKVSGVKTNLKL